MPHRMPRPVLALALAAGALSAPPLAAQSAETTLVTTRYTCARGVEVPASYINAPDTSLVVIHVEGRQITLFSEETGSGARYAWPSDGAGYVWWTKGKEATLFWKEGGQETPILEGCVELG
jgi:membrane-bound inhibitor of C-type lysozyme